MYKNLIGWSALLSIFRSIIIPLYTRLQPDCSHHLHYQSSNGRKNATNLKNGKYGKKLLCFENLFICEKNKIKLGKYWLLLDFSTDY
jgi:hypothetical protein